MIRQSGKIYHYFDCKMSRESYEGLSYAIGRGWRVLDTQPSRVGYERFCCEPIRVNKVGQNEIEIAKKDWKD